MQVGVGLSRWGWVLGSCFRVMVSGDGRDHGSAGAGLGLRRHAATEEAGVLMGLWGVAPGVFGLLKTGMTRIG